MRRTAASGTTADPFTLYGWQVSCYTGKVRSYLRFKGIPCVETPPNIFDYYVKLRRKTGVVAIPVLRTPEGEWLQDSSEIIDRLEARFPAPSIMPATPVQRLAAYLFELWGDEFWLPAGLITRWCHPDENYAFLEQDVADNLLPGWPRWLQKKAAAKVAQHMYRYLPQAGVVPEQYAVLNRWTEQQVDALDRHFAAHPFLFGEMLPYLEGMLRVAAPAMEKPATLPRFMDDVEFPMGGGRYRRPAMPYGLWMLQRALDAVRAMPPADVDAVRGWLARHDALRLLEIRMPRLRRVGMRVAPVQPQPVDTLTPTYLARNPRIP